MKNQDKIVIKSIRIHEIKDNLKSFLMLLQAADYKL